MTVEKTVEINGQKVYDNIGIRKIYKNARKSTYTKCDELFEQGYLFIANNNEMLGFTKRWELYEPIRVAGKTSSRIKPSMLWAIKPLNLRQ